MAQARGMLIFEAFVFKADSKCLCPIHILLPQALHPITDGQPQSNPNEIS